MANFIWPLTPINQGPIKYSSDGVPTDVSVDTVTPANSTPLPVRQLNADGTIFDASVSEGYLQTLAAFDFATETTLSSIDTKVATETTLQTLATEATVSTLATEATVSTLATEATVSTLATEATVSTLGTEATLSTLATEATVSTLGTEATLSTLGTEATLQSVESYASSIDLKVATEATLASAASDVNSILQNQLSIIDSSNTTSTPLGAGATFTGAPIDITQFATISVAAFSDVSSATNGLKMEFSPDGINWDHVHNFSVTGNVGVSYNQSAELVFFRIVYINGASAQTTFRLTTVVRRAAIDPSRYALTDSLQDGYLANVTKSVIWGKTTAGGGSYEQVKVNPSGALTVHATVTSSVLPTGAATESTLSSLNGKVTTVDTSNVTVVASALPTGAATLSEQQTQSTTLSNISGKLPATLGQKTSANSLAVTIASDQSSLPTVQQGMAKSNAPIYVSYSSTNVTTSAYVELIASTTAATKRVCIFDSSGQAMIFAVGGSGSEVTQLYVPPGGAEFDLAIPASSRIAIKALTASATSGYILINLLG